ncbi:MAG TPA: choice-of-anchor D domain-containing protein [Candidatus Angelobacter sp.]
MRFLSYAFASLFALSSVSTCFAQTQRLTKLDTLNYFSLPSLGFEENLGQFENDSCFVSQSSGFDVFLERSGLVIAFHSRSQTKPELVRIRFTGANKGAEPRGTDMLPGVTHYYIGSDAAKWKTGIRRFGQVRYPGIYPGVNLVFYRDQRQLEFDYDLAPGADSSILGLAVDGAAVRIDHGNLELKTASGKVAILKKPELYQLHEGKRRQIGGSYFLRNSSEVAFKIGKYDKHLPLVIDPALIYSTLVGAANLDMVPLAIAADNSGAYVTGQSQSPNPEPSAFVMKLDPTGSTLVYLTHLSGSTAVSPGSSLSTFAAGFAIAVDAGGDSYITGLTFEPDFPTTSGAFSTTHLCANGGKNLGCYEAFASKLDPNGKLVYSTFLVQPSPLDTAGPMPSSIAIDSSGALYVTGATFQQPFPLCNGCMPVSVAGLTPTPGAFQASRKNNSSGFVLKLHPDGSKLDYSTYLGGSTSETGGGIAVDSTGAAYVDGGTSSADFPTTPGAFQTANSGTNAFFSKLKPDGSGLLYSTFLSGPKGQSEATSIAVDSNNAAYLVGITDSTVPARSFERQQEPVFVAKFDASGNNLYSASLSENMTVSYNLLVGAPPESSIAVDNSGAAYVAVGSGGITFEDSIFVSKVDTNGSTVYTASVGPIDSGSGTFGGMAMDGQQNLYVAGVEDGSQDKAGPSPVIIPGVVTTAGSFQPLPLPADNSLFPGPSGIAFVQKFAQSLGKAVAAPNPRLVTFFTPIQPGAKSNPRTVTLFNFGDADLTINRVSVGGTNASDFAISNNQCASTVKAGANCTLLVTFTPTVAQGTRTATVDFSFAGGVASQSTGLSGQAGVPVFQATPSPLDFGSVAVGNRGGPNILTIMNTGTAPINLLVTPAILGANSSDFFVCVLAVGHCGGQFNWPQSIDPGKQLVVPIAFIPSAAGSRSAQLVLQTDLPGSPQTVQLTGNAVNFNIVASPTSSATVSAGQAATYNLIFTTGSTFSGTVSFNCSGAPPASSCSLTPSSLSVTPSTTQDVSLMVSTTARKSVFQATPPPNSWWLLATAVVGFMMIGLRRFPRMLRLAAASALFATMLSCGGGNGSGSGGGGGGGTPAGTYTVTVTVTGSGSSVSTPVTLTVQ